MTIINITIQVVIYYKYFCNEIKMKDTIKYMYLILLIYFNYNLLIIIKL